MTDLAAEAFQQTEKAFSQTGEAITVAGEAQKLAREFCELAVQATERCKKALRERDELMAALHYYADPDIYEGMGMESFAEIEGDKGDRARASLAKVSA